MKKFLITMCCAVMLLATGICAFGFSKPQSVTTYAAAQEISTPAYIAAVETETPAPETTDAEENPTLFGRIYEWCKANYLEIITTAGDVIIFIILIVNHVKSKKKLLSIENSTEKTAGTNGEVVEVVNQLIDGYNKSEEAQTQAAQTEDERYKMVASMVVQTKAILEILTTVYANSKNVPQGIKDIINLKYADVLKNISSDQALKELVFGKDAETKVNQELSEETKTEE